MHEFPNLQYTAKHDGGFYVIAAAWNKVIYINAIWIWTNTNVTIVYIAHNTHTNVEKGIPIGMMI